MVEGIPRMGGRSCNYALSPNQNTGEVKLLDGSRNLSYKNQAECQGFPYLICNTWETTKLLEPHLIR
jgi:hypothetical protein